MLSKHFRETQAQLGHRLNYSPTTCFLSGTMNQSDRPPVTPLLQVPDSVEFLSSTQPVTFIAEYDGAAVWPFPITTSRLTVGNGFRNEHSTIDAKPSLVIPGRNLSDTHFALDRRDNGIVLSDWHSKNGIWLPGRGKVAQAHLQSGDKFHAWPMVFILLDQSMYDNRPLLATILGRGNAISPDKLITDIARQSSPVTISGPSGCWQDRLADAIHQMSQRARARAIYVPDIPPLLADQAVLVKAAAKQKTTAIVHIPKRRRVQHDRHVVEFFAALCDPTYGIRVIALAATDDDAEAAMPRQAFKTSANIALRSLNYRTDEIEQLLNDMFKRGDADNLSTARLTAENQQALSTFEWSNLDELQELADAIIKLENHGGLRAASRETGIKKSQLHSPINRAGFKMHRIGDTASDTWSVFEQ